jgi:quinol monooxygenase YgiN
MQKSGTVDKIRAEEGNLRYEYFQALDDNETILLIDSWESQEAIDKHHASLMMKTIAQLREKYDLHMTVERYIGADSLTFLSEAGMLEAGRRTDLCMACFNGRYPTALYSHGEES